MLTLNKLLGLWKLLVGAKRQFYVRVFGMDIHPTAQFSLSAYFDRTFPKGVHIGKHLGGAQDDRPHPRPHARPVPAHPGGRELLHRRRRILMPGVQIGDDSIVAAGAVVTKDVPRGSIVAGNPATVIREDIDVMAYGRFRNADETTARLRAEGLL